MISPIRGILSGIIVVLSALGCAKEDSQLARSASDDDVNIRRDTANTASIKSAQIDLTDLESEQTSWALANCECLEPISKTQLVEKLTGRGVLPQILVPTVREEIKNNAALRLLASIPLGNLLAGLIVTDTRLANDIKAGLSSKLEKGAPGGTNINDRISFRFDAFIPRENDNSSFHLSDQLTSWLYLFNTPGMWEGADPLDGVDHGSQTLDLLRTLSEWKYLIGLDQNSDGGLYGGLGLTVTNNKKVMIGPVDPQSKPTKNWFVSGGYMLGYENAASVDLATKAQEKWHYQNGDITLDEQAKLWRINALAFKRLRPENRALIGSLFSGDDQAVLPDNAHTLALAFLQPLNVLLSGPFIEKEAQLVRSKAVFGNRSQTAKALPLDLARLGMALSTWLTEFQDVTAANLSRDLEEQLEDAAKQLIPALQLTVQTILKDYVRPLPKEHGDRDSMMLVGPHGQLELDAAAEIIVMLITAEREHLTSAFLRKKIQQILNWYIIDMASTRDVFKYHELIWMRLLVNQLETFPGRNNETVSSFLALKSFFSTEIAKARK